MDTTVTFKQEETSGHEPQSGLDTKTDRLTDLQSQCYFDFDLFKSVEFRGASLPGYELGSRGIEASELLITVQFSCEKTSCVP
jgi:hypothetical protein